MTKPNLKIIEGGLGGSDSREREFISAFCTDTRLMGAVAMGIMWNTGWQFFSFDCEYAGVDNYLAADLSDTEQLLTIDRGMIGTLGGSKVDITEREARALFTRYYERSIETDSELPPGLKECSFLTDEPVYLDEKENSVLMEKICCEIKSEYQLINYFLMRCVAHDVEAAYHLAPEIDITSFHPELHEATLYKNTIENGTSVGEFVCRSLVESGAEYRLLSTTVTLNGLEITNCECGEPLHISYTEAALMLRHTEFVTVFEIADAPEETMTDPLLLDYNTTVTTYDGGELYVAFNKDNSHVANKTYMLHDDVFGLYFITDFGELIVTAYDVRNISKLENDILATPMRSRLAMTGRFEFPDPVLYDFVSSGFESFEDFLSAITDDH